MKTIFFLTMVITLLFSSMSHAAFKGYTDGVTTLYSTSYITGWACTVGDDSPVQVHVYARDTSGTFSFLKAATANRTSEEAVSSACGTETRKHRYSVEITDEMMQEHSLETIYVFAVAGGKNLALTNYDKFVIPPKTKIGIMYSLWHCLATAGNPYYDINDGNFGPVGTFHWSDAAAFGGYYCLRDNPALAVNHAEVLRDMGIDFVYLDITNWAYGESAGDQAILEPLDTILLQWKLVVDAPKIVPWVRIQTNDVNGESMMDRVLVKLNASKNGSYDPFLYLDSKPLVMVVHPRGLGSDTFDIAKYNSLKSTYEMRKVWANFPQAELNDAETWSFMQRCIPDFSQGITSANCDQVVSTPGGTVDSISVNTAYQITRMTDPTAVPNHGGVTFEKQMKVAFDEGDPDFILIQSWNELIAQRQPDVNGTFAFVDMWTGEYSKDIEPGTSRGSVVLDYVTPIIHDFKKWNQR